MFKPSGVLLILTFCFAFGMSAQDGAVVRANLTDLLVGRHSLGVEVGVNPHLSLGCDFDFISREVFLESSHPWFVSKSARKRGGIVEPQVRWYPGERGLKGGYAALSGFFGYAFYQHPDGWGGVHPPEWSAVGGSFHVGHQVGLGRFMLDGFLGGTWTRNGDLGVYEESTALFPPPTGLRFSGGLRLGCQLR